MEKGLVKAIDLQHVTGTFIDTERVNGNVNLGRNRARDKVSIEIPLSIFSDTLPIVPARCCLRYLYIAYVNACHHMN